MLRHMSCIPLRQKTAPGIAPFRRVRSARYTRWPMCPVVLHHGIFGFGNFNVGPVYVPFFRGGIERALAERGHPLIVTRVHPTAGVAERARQLKESILRQVADRRLDDQPVIIIAHSMGGLDARYMIARLGMEKHVRALLTLSTPHRGSSFADWVMLHLGQRLRAAQLVAALRLNWRAVFDLTRRECQRFNEETPDSPSVRYFSISASQPARLMPKFLLLSHRIIAAAEGDNDGLVSVASSTWGTHLGIWPADHFHLINRRFTRVALRREANITPRYLAALDAMDVLSR
jgi:triacylglycerol lipase